MDGPTLRAGQTLFSKAYPSTKNHIVVRRHVEEIMPSVTLMGAYLDIREVKNGWNPMRVYILVAIRAGNPHIYNLT